MNDQQKIIFRNYNYIQVPQDSLEYAERLGGICGEAAIGALLGCNIKEVFLAWGIGENNFGGYTLQKEMRFILEKLGYSSQQRSVKDKKVLPDTDFAILRVSFGNPSQHWSKTATLSHYLALKRFQQGWYIYDNAIDLFDGKPINGLWIEKSEYPQWMEDQDMFITSYLEIKKKPETRIVRKEGGS